MKFGKRLKEVLVQKGITQYRLSKLSGIAQATLSDLMSGKNNAPTLDTILKISNALDLTVSELIGEVEEEYSPEMKSLIRLAGNMTKKELNAMINVADIIVESKREHSCNSKN